MPQSMQVTNYFLDQLLAAGISSSLLTGLVAYYPFPAGGNFLNDVSGNANNLTQSGTVTAGTGPVSSAAEFPGSAAHLVSTNGFNLNASFSFFLWFNPTGDATFQTLLSFGSSSNQLYLNEALGNRGTFSGSTVGGGPTFTPNQWNTALYMYDGTNQIATVGLNGTLVSSAETNTAGTQLMTFGQTTGGAQQLTGGIAELGAWNRVLTAPELKNLGMALTYPFSGY